MTNEPNTDSESKICPQQASLHAAVDGSLPADEQARLAEHLNECDSCQQRVQEIAGADDVLPASKWTHAAAETSIALDQVMQRLRRGDPRPRSTDPAELLQFLSPSSDPGYIGQFGPYDVLELVGRGGMGLVLKAYDRSLNRIVAIKVLLPELSAGPEARQRFVREAQAAAAVIHENVVTIHAVDEHEGLPFLVMEYIEGESLQNRIENGQIDVPEILRIGSQICAGLGAAHSQGLVHRDIKPANILLQNGIARVKITDFGLAKAVDDVGITRTGTIAGTPQYLSPEQADAQNVDHRTDLFSLGGVLYAMCTGSPPFNGESTARIIRQVCDEQPRPIAKLNEGIPAKLIGVIRKLLEKDPRRRYASAADVKQELLQQLSQTQGAGNLAPQRLGFKNLAAIIAGVVALAALAFFANDSVSGWFNAFNKAADATNPTLVDARSPVGGLDISRDFRFADSGLRFATLAEAVSQAGDGEVIEVCGDGPFETDVIQVLDKSLTIRAAEGYRPKLTFTSPRNGNGIVSDSDLRLEGLMLTAQRRPHARELNPMRKCLLSTRGDKLEIIRCKILAEDGIGVAFDGMQLHINDTVIVAQNACGVKWQLRPHAIVEIRNCILAANTAIGIMRPSSLDDNSPCQLNVSRSNLVGDFALRYESKSARRRGNNRARLGDLPKLEMNVSDSIVDAERFFQFNAPPGRHLPNSELAARLLSTLIEWTESQNFYRENIKMALFVLRDQQEEFLADNSLSHWQEHFYVSDPRSLQGAIVYRNGDDGEVDYYEPSLTPIPADGLQVGASRSE